MTKKQFIEKCNKIKKDIDKMYEEKLEYMLENNSHYIKHADNDYIVPKIFMVAFGREIEERYGLLSTEYNNEPVESIIEKIQSHF
jgi:hypothetical protein